jgi:hypothetical protein
MHGIRRAGPVKLKARSETTNNGPLIQLYAKCLDLASIGNTIFSSLIGPFSTNMSLVLLSRLSQFTGSYISIVKASSSST